MNACPQPTMLIPQEKFTGIENITHLATGGESPALKSHQDAVGRFFAAKAKGEDCRYEIEATYARAQEKVANLLNVNTDEIAFLNSATDGINTLAYAIDWQPGDNVVISDVEFPSDVLVWTKFETTGVEVRVVRHVDWVIRPEDIAAQIDEHTRVVAISYVSYFTGQRQNLADGRAVITRLRGIAANYVNGLVNCNVNFFFLNEDFLAINADDILLRVGFVTQCNHLTVYRDPSGFNNFLAGTARRGPCLRCERKRFRQNTWRLPTVTSKRSSTVRLRKPSR